MPFKMVLKNTFLILLFSSFLSITSGKAQNKSTNRDIIVGAQKIETYLPMLIDKKVGVVANQTSVIFKKEAHTHLIDSLIQLKINIIKVFSPEHGFRGTYDAAEHVSNSTDPKTGLPIISLHGKHKKPTIPDLKNLDVILFDIQDVGVRFYTFLSTLHLVMEACSENNIPVILLDRPNPNGHYIDGPTLKTKYSSFVGKHPVPLVYGMTIGEYADMINGEKWLKNETVCDLTIVPLTNYTHQKEYHLPIKPSPNLPNAVAINLYPSLGFFEGTPINAGRGTNHQFQQYGSAKFPNSSFGYTPQSNKGSKNPKDKNKLCHGITLKNTPRLNKINIKWLIDAYEKYPDKEKFFGATFTSHVGDTLLRHQLKEKYTAKQIEESWNKDLDKFKRIRAKYLLYP